jgi:hypothetical protein
VIRRFGGQNCVPSAPAQASGAASSLTVGSFSRVVKDTDILTDLRIGATFSAILFASMTFPRPRYLNPT